MLVFMLSFAGVPPTLGFAGKFYLLKAVIEAEFYILAVIAVLASLISAYYYLRVVIIMYMKPGEPEVYKETWLNAITAISAIGTVVLFFFSTPIFEWAAQAVLYIF